MRSILASIMLLIGLVITGSYQVKACSCKGRPHGTKGIQTCGYYWGSENVFVGTAEKVEIDNKVGSMKVTFSVERPIRGINEKSVEIFTSASTASCGYPFKQGERYLVYGRKDSGGKLQEFLCGPTVLLKDAEDDLEYIKDIEEGKPGTRIWGTVFEDSQPTIMDQRRSVPLSSIEITIKNGKYTFKTATDENGNYLFKDIPRDTYEIKDASNSAFFSSYPGGYKVFAKLPNGYRELFTRQDLTEHFAGGCSGVNFRVTKQGSIRGKVVKFPTREIQNPWDRNPEQQPKVTLIPLDGNGNIIPNRLYDEAWAYRDKFDYYFDFVPAGLYLLALNPANCPYPNNGVRPTFFPGVAGRSQATIISVREGEQLVLKDFRSLPLLNKRSISGIVSNPDGTLGVNVTVRLRDAGRCSNFQLESKTDEEGRFSFQGFETYEYRVDAHVDRKNGLKQVYAWPIIVPKEGNVDRIVLILDQSL